ncbi:deaminase [Streptomyces sp. NPDC058369]|uniref:deaminase n=1 Tax=Streptomyces sp. NPDC058369 TaxID=3346462 RepID=UPI0036605891
MTFSRPSFDEYYLAGAEWASTRADCTRAQVGALLVSKDHVVTPGYNGLISGIPGCATAGNCPRGRHYQVDPDVCAVCKQSTGIEFQCTCYRPVRAYACACGDVWPCPDSVAPDSNYANCAATHAERNAIERANPEDLPGATIYTTREPCPACWTLIKCVGVQRAVWRVGVSGSGFSTWEREGG